MRNSKKRCASMLQYLSPYIIPYKYKLHLNCCSLLAKLSEKKTLTQYHSHAFFHFIHQPSAIIYAIFQNTIAEQLTHDRITFERGASNSCVVSTFMRKRKNAMKIYIYICLFEPCQSEKCAFAHCGLM